VSACSYLAAVNQKLLFAKKLIQLVDSAEGSANDRHIQAVIAQSIATQLYHAWNWHIKDVASNYKVKDPSAINSVDDLVDILKADGKEPGEATELKNLFYSPTSWVRELVDAYFQLADLPEIRKAEMDVDRLPVLALETGAAGGKKIIDWNLSTAINWSKQMVELVDRQREMMIEF
jgi:hypothetical protein